MANYGETLARAVALRISPASPVADATALAAIPAAERSDGMICLVSSDNGATNAPYVYSDSSSASTSSGIVVVPSDNPSTGRWLALGAADPGGLFTATTLVGQLQEVKTLADAGMTVQKKTVTVGHADLTDAVAGEAQAINIGTSLPNNARIIGVDMRALTPFTGGSVSSVTCDVGTSGDVDALIDGADLQTAAVDGGPATMPKGVRPNKTFASGGQLLATFYPDGGHALDALTAGSVIIDVLYAVLA